MLAVFPSVTQAQTTVLGPASGRPLSTDAILPADVLARVELVRSELELIRFEMGQPQARPFELAATGVAPRQTLYQALTLFRNANQLYLEVTGDPGSELAMDSPDDIRPLHVWKIVDAAYSRLADVKHRLGIAEQVREERQDTSTTPTEVFRSITVANKQLQILIRNRITTNDVFQQVALATEYAARVLQRFPGAKPVPDAPAFERGKRPVDVYNLLVSCYARMFGIVTKSGLGALKLEAATPEHGILDPAQIRPSEVYDVATLLVSELAYIHSQLENADPPVQIQFPGLKLPSHVYQKARVLLLQLSELEERVAAHPNWHTRSD